MKSRQVKELERQLQEVTQRAMYLYDKAMFNGAFLADEPFIPEYIGFSTQEIRDKDDVMVCRLYTKDGFSVSRYLSADKPEWIIVRPDMRQTEIVIPSMEMGIKILQASGMDISVEKYLMSESVQNEIPEPETDPGITA